MKKVAIRVIIYSFALGIGTFLWNLNARAEQQKSNLAKEYELYKTPYMYGYRGEQEENVWKVNDKLPYPEYKDPYGTMIGH